MLRLGKFLAVPALGLALAFGSGAEQAKADFGLYIGNGASFGPYSSFGYGVRPPVYSSYSFGYGSSLPYYGSLYNSYRPSYSYRPNVIVVPQYVRPRGGYYQGHQHGHSHHSHHGRRW